MSHTGVNAVCRRAHASRNTEGGGIAAERTVRLWRSQGSGRRMLLRPAAWRALRAPGRHTPWEESPMPFTSGKQAFLEILKQEGVEVMFGNPGTTELPLMDGLARETRIRYILALQEAVAIAMTDGYAQASGKLAAVNVHTSPGLGNAMGMLYDASKAGSPLLLTAGQHDQAMNLTEPILWSDLPPVARPYVKWSHEITRLEDLPRAVRRAAKTAKAHPTGPVFISLPVDVLNAERDIDLLETTRVAPRIRGDKAAIEAAADLPLKVAILGDPKATLPELAEAIRKRLTPGATRAAQARAEALGKAREAKIADLKERARRESGQTPISPLALVAAVADAVPDDAVVVDESISSGGGLRELLRSRDAKGFFGLRGGGIGWGLPAALGIKLAQPSRPVVALVGDGSAMYTIQSFWTAAHDSIPVVWVIFNNASYRILKQRTLALKGFSAEDDKYVAMDLVNPRLDYLGLAKAQGGPGEPVEKSADVGPAIHRGLASV